MKTLEILEQLKSLTLHETAQLVKQIEATFHVDASRPKVISLEKRQEEDEVKPLQTEFDVVLQFVRPDRKIAVLKVMRMITELGLKEVKDLAESLPQVVRAQVDRDTAESLKHQLEEAGAVVTIA